jgi:hypothetical protein
MSALYFFYSRRCPFHAPLWHGAVQFAASQIKARASVTSTVLQHYIAGHCRGTRYGFPISAFSQDGRILVGTSLMQYCKGADATVRPVPPGTYKCA